MNAIATLNLVSYDPSLTLPIEIHLIPGPTPRAVACYEDSPDVEYEDLGALCEAHKLDPEMGLDEVRAAEFAARTN